MQCFDWVLSVKCTFTLYAACQFFDLFIFLRSVLIEIFPSDPAEDSNQKFENIGCREYWNTAVETNRTIQLN